VKPTVTGVCIHQSLERGRQQPWKYHAAAPIGNAVKDVLLKILGKTKASDAIQSRQGRRLDAVGDSRRIWSLMIP